MGVGDDPKGDYSICSEGMHLAVGQDRQAAGWGRDILLQPCQRAATGLAGG